MTDPIQILLARVYQETQKPYMHFFPLPTHQESLKRVLSPAQIALLLPPNKETHSCKFDPTLSLVIMRNFTTLITLNGRWDTLLPNDNSLAANAVRAVLLRNYLYHYHDITLMTKQEFDKKWTEAENIAAGLLYFTVNITKLKTKTLDPEGNSVKKEFCRYLNSKLDKLKQDYEELKTKSEADGIEIAAKIKHLEQEVILIKEDGDRAQSSKGENYVLILLKSYFKRNNLIYKLF